MYRWLCMALLLIPGLAVAATPSPSAAKILMVAKVANGGSRWNNIHSLHLVGHIQRGGLAGAFQQSTNLRTGQWVMASKLGAFRVTSGFDGKLDWRAAPGGAVFEADAPHAKRVAVSQAFRNAYGWWRSRHWPAARRFLGVRECGRQTCDVIRMTPRGGTSFNLWINAHTHLVARIADHDYALPRIVYYSNYRSVHGVKIPFRERVAIGTQQHAATITLESVQANPAAAQPAYNPPAAHLANFTFAGGKHSVTIPFRLLPGGHMLVSVKVNGHPMRFVVDSGSGGEGILTAHAAAIAGVHGAYAGKVSVTGKHAVKTGFAMVSRLQIGDEIALHNEVVRIAALPHARIDGTLGADFFARFVVRIDYRHRTMTLTSPRDFDAADAGTLVPLLFSRGGVPLVQGSFDGFGGVFEADTGGTILTLFTPFAKAHRLFARYQHVAVAHSEPGLGGGRLPYVRVHAGTLRMGRVALRNPAVEMSPVSIGFLGNRYVAGNIGGRIWAHFIVTFDDANHTLYLKPQA
ncbi:MAG TPA: aspartyl protease family protein [Rhodanobacteraceae bacterium]